MANILEANSGINQCQPFALLEKKTVADNGGVGRNHERPTVDMVNRCHAAPLTMDELPIEQASSYRVRGIRRLSRRESFGGTCNKRGHFALSHAPFLARKCWCGPCHQACTWRKAMAAKAFKAILLVLASLVAADASANSLEVSPHLAASGGHAVVRAFSADDNADPDRETFVVSHGLGGTSAGDRFEQLCLALHHDFPQAAVYLVDWSREATAQMFGLPNPWAVAPRIDGVAEEAAKLLQDLGVRHDHLTLIGESFGAYVNAGIARSLGKCERILAVNPANEAAGYLPPDMRELAAQSWSLQTHSFCDTSLELTDYCVYLAAATTDAVAQHKYGIQWLAERLSRGDTSWVMFSRTLAAGPVGCFDGTARADGVYESQFEPLLPPIEPIDSAFSDDEHRLAG